MRKFLASTAIAATIFGGAATLGSVNLAGAQEADDEATNDTDEAPSAEDCAARREARQAARAAQQQEIADVLGLTVEDLQAQSDAGSSLAEIAGDQTDQVIAIIVENVGERIAMKVEEGRITQEMADERLETVDERVTARVNGEAPERGEGRRGHRGHGPRGDDAPADGAETPEDAEVSA